MRDPYWQLTTPIDAVLFDCDGTLSTIEGIDALAEINGHAETVKKLTAEAMGKTGLTTEIYKQRIELVRPTQKQVLALGQDYYDHRVPDITEVLYILRQFKKEIYIASAGLYPSVLKFGELLEIPKENIFAVDVRFDANGDYQSFDKHSPLTRAQGKCEIVEKIKQKHPKLLFTGDGLNDLDAYNLVTRFVGYGGTFYRANIAEQCQFYINTLSFSPLLPLALTAEETRELQGKDHELYQRGLSGVLLRPEFK